MCWKSHERMTLVACLGRTPRLFLDELSSLLKKPKFWFICSCKDLREKAQQVSVFTWEYVRLILFLCGTALKHFVHAVYICEVHTWVFCMWSLFGVMAWVMTWPWGVITVTGWYTAPPGEPKNQSKNKQQRKNNCHICSSSLFKSTILRER